MIFIDDLIYNYMAFLEAVFSHEEVLPDIILEKYGLMELTHKDIRKLEAIEMRRLQQEDMTLEEIARRYEMTNSGVFRRIKRWL